MHYKEVKAILSPQNGMNLYRGCTHGCIYCDSRSKCYRILHEFEDVEVKINAPILLEKTLRKKRVKGMISTGAMTDPYIPLEEELRLTRKCLNIIERFEFGVCIITKSDRILRDIDILERINRKTKCVVQMTLTCYDDEMSRIIEPNVSLTCERFKVLMEMKKRKIPTIVWMTPILPYINDTKENIKGLLEYCREASVYGIMNFGMGLTLREGSREYYYKMLDQKFPGLKEKYILNYKNSYEIPSPQTDILKKVFYDFCKQNKIETNTNRLFRYMREYENNVTGQQMTMDDFFG